jgi:acyl-CoA synthetase
MTTTEISVTDRAGAGAGYEVQAVRCGRSRPGLCRSARLAKSAGRGGALMLGYFDNQAATESSFNRDGWFMSGDLGVLDARGNLKVVGRSKDLIIRGGHTSIPRTSRPSPCATRRWRAPPAFL